MSRTAAILGLSLAFALAGCASGPPPATLEQLAVWRAEGNRPLVCRSGPECDRMWNRPYDWVRDHTVYGIKNATSRTIETDRPRSKYDAAPNHTVVRASLGQGRERPGESAKGAPSQTNGITTRSWALLRWRGYGNA